MRPDGTAGRLVGIAIAAWLSASFWMAILAIAMPLFGTTPGRGALALTGMTIASFVSATLLALGHEA